MAKQGADRLHISCDDHSAVARGANKETNLIPFHACLQRLTRCCDGPTEQIYGVGRIEKFSWVMRRNLDPCLSDKPGSGLTRELDPWLGERKLLISGLGSPPSTLCRSPRRLRQCIYLVRHSAFACAREKCAVFTVNLPDPPHKS